MPKGCRPPPYSTTSPTPAFIRRTTTCHVRLGEQRDCGVPEHRAATELLPRLRSAHGHGTPTRRAASVPPAEDERSNRPRSTSGPRTRTSITADRNSRTPAETPTIASPICSRRPTPSPQRGVTTSERTKGTPTMTTNRNKLGAGLTTLIASGLLMMAVPAGTGDAASLWKPPMPCVALRRRDAGRRRVLPRYVRCPRLEPHRTKTQGSRRRQYGGDRQSRTHHTRSIVSKRHVSVWWTAAGTHLGRTQQAQFIRILSLPAVPTAADISITDTD